MELMTNRKRERRVKNFAHGFRHMENGRFKRQVTRQKKQKNNAEGWTFARCTYSIFNLEIASDGAGSNRIGHDMLFSGNGQRSVSTQRREGDTKEKICITWSTSQPSSLCETQGVVFLYPPGGHSLILATPGTSWYFFSCINLAWIDGTAAGTAAQTRSRQLYRRTAVRTDKLHLIWTNGLMRLHCSERARRRTAVQRIMQAILRTAVSLYSCSLIQLSPNIALADTSVRSYDYSLIQLLAALSVVVHTAACTVFHFLTLRVACAPMQRIEIAFMRSSEIKAIAMKRSNTAVTQQVKKMKRLLCSQQMNMLK